MKTKKNSISIILLFLLITFIVFFKFFLKGLLPIPSDLLVSFYFPWNSGGWEGYSPWTTHKEFIGSDAIRQHLPWLKFSIDEIKAGNLPYWNPYFLSGNPNIANIQTFIFYPLNFIFLIFSLHLAWSILVVLQIFLGQVFMFLFLKKLKISTFPAILGSMAFVFSSYLMTNLEINIIGHTLIWLPLSLFSLEMLFESQKFRYFLLAVFCFSSIFLAGHPQTVIQIILYIGLFVLYKSLSSKSSRVLFLGTLPILFGFAISSFVVLPSIYLYTHSPLGGTHPHYYYFLIPIKNLIAFFAQDYFGNSATNNFWSNLYGDGTPHIGPIVLLFSLFSLLFVKKSSQIKFFAFVSILFLLLAIQSPITSAMESLSVPIFSASNMSRNISMTLFSLIVLGSIGLENFIKEKSSNKGFIRLAIIFSLIYLLIFVYTLINYLGAESVSMKINYKVSLRNLLIPASVVFIFLLSYSFLKKKTKLYLILILVLSFISFFYSFNKYLPFSKKEFFFPSHPVINFLQSKAGINRFYGQGTAYLGTNFSSYYKLYSPEGYSLLRGKRYAELIAASKNGNLQSDFSRSDAEFPTSENGYRKRIFDLLGVKYLLDKEDIVEREWDPEPEKFEPDRVKLIWQSGKFKVYEREEVLPRFFLTNSYMVLSQAEILNNIYDKGFSLKTILLETKPDLPIKNEEEFYNAELTLYQQDRIIFKTSAPKNAILFLSDAYYPGWSVKVDDQQKELLIADYAFRAVVVPAGNHIVEFEYKQILFPIGILLMIISFSILTVASIYFIKVKKF